MSSREKEGSNINRTFCPAQRNWSFLEARASLPKIFNRRVAGSELRFWKITREDIVHPQVSAEGHRVRQEAGGEGDLQWTPQLLREEVTHLDQTGQQEWRGRMRREWVWVSREVESAVVNGWVQKRDHGGSSSHGSGWNITLPKAG